MNDCYNEQNVMVGGSFRYDDSCSTTATIPRHHHYYVVTIDDDSQQTQLLALIRIIRSMAVSDK